LTGQTQPRDISAMFLLIDNYDSFTFNLLHGLEEQGAACRVVRNDAMAVEELLSLEAEALVISPGPATPDDSGVCLDLVRAAAGRLPILGVCLGHQIIGQVYGGKVIRAPAPMHGKVSQITHDGAGLFAGVPSPLGVVRYHSLVVERATCPAELQPNAWTEDGLIMALQHRTLPIYGVQFHPESIASDHGSAMLANFVAIARDRPAARRAA
jgi:anthranilate synthase/aminodeoxychorismate synthase-like glutamine amidotransferase